ncbi:MAG: hypothetical protein ACR2P0_18945 [Acidimicrobiales bacterium]
MTQAGTGTQNDREVAQPAARQRKCRRCTRAMVAITLDIDGRFRTLRSCSHCDIREWATEATDTELSDVLNELADSARS